MRDALFAIGVLLSTASQLRPEGAAVGPGEACLLLWLGWIVVGSAAWDVPLTPALTRLLGFWAVFALAQAAGALMGMAIDNHRDTGSLLHDAIAYVLLACVSCLTVIEPGAAGRLRAAAWRLSIFGAALLIAQIANAWGAFSMPSVDPWYWDRLRGWSENPNQLALLCAVLALLSLHLAETAGGTSRAVCATVCAGIALYAGILTKSDAFYAVAMAGLVIFLILKVRSWLASLGRELTLAAGFFWLVVISLPAIAIATAPFAIAVAQSAHDAATGVYQSDHEGEAAIRFSLWSEAWQRSVDSAFIGLGPGAHLVRTAYKREPPPNFEAHNTFLDLLTQGGALAVLGVVWLLVSSLLVPFRARRAALTTLVCGLAIFSSFHLIVRLPIFWFAIAICLVPLPQVVPPSATMTRR